MKKASVLLVAIALALFARAPVDGEYVADILPVMLVLGLGIGVCFPALMNLAMSGATQQDAGLASGLVNTSQQVGGALGLAILVAVANSTTSGQFADGVRDRAVALTEGFQTALLVGAGFAILGALLAYLLVDGREVEENVDGDLVPVTT